MTQPLGLIAGSGIEKLFEVKETKEVSTPYGAPSEKIDICDFNGDEICFLRRHGKGHVIQPHKVNYKANIWALKELGVRKILSISAVGSLKEELSPGMLVFPSQFIDHTKKRDHTFYDKKDEVYHLSSQEPLCTHLRKILSDSAKEIKIPFTDGVTYICIEGPRFSTVAESKMFQHFADVIGMTMVPEAPLARELQMCYANISMVTDYDCWKDSEVTHATVEKTMRDNIENVKRLLESAIPKIEREQTCRCKNSLDGALASSPQKK